MSVLTDPQFTHLNNMSDGWGLFEHAEFDQPRKEHGYCLDDVARGLIVTSRNKAAESSVRDLHQIYLAFVDAAITSDGKAHNRRDVEGEWTDSPGVGDWWGRAIWGLGNIVADTSRPQFQGKSFDTILRALQQRSRFVRTNVFAAIGAAETLLACGGDLTVRSFILEALENIPRLPTAEWRWPEARMSYANGSLVEALIAAGTALDDEALIRDGLQLLDFLLRTELNGEHLSVTGVGGRDHAAQRPQFDQQPIEVSALADASVRAYEATENPTWLLGLNLAWQWFGGENDAAIPMYDLPTGAGFDGLTERGRNENRGAESTLAAMSTHQLFLQYAPLMQALL
jgi:hypothetical protein